MDFGLNGIPYLVFDSIFEFSNGISLHCILVWHIPRGMWLASKLEHPLSGLFDWTFLIPLLFYLAGLVSLSSLPPELAHPFCGMLVVLSLPRS